MNKTKTRKGKKKRSTTKSKNPRTNNKVLKVKGRKPARKRSRGDGLTGNRTPLDNIVTLID